MKRFYIIWNTVVLSTIILLNLSSRAKCQDSCPADEFLCESATEANYDAGENNDEGNGNDTYDYGPYLYPGEPGTTTSCLSVTHRCDGKEDCLNCADEKNCSTPQVFWCGSEDSGLCIPLSKRCDNVSDCRDGSDECDCPGSLRCQGHYRNEQCIPASRVCDGKFDCENGEDETERCEVYVCPSNQKKVPLFQLCDGANNCGDSNKSDECNCSSTYVCQSGECINISAKCDGNPDCQDGSDECDCPEENQVRKTFKCKGSGKCIKMSKVCDKALDCGSYPVKGVGANGQSEMFHAIDCSDELEGNCSTYYQCEDAKSMLRSGLITSDLQTCVRSQYKCDGDSHCNDGSDECHCSDSVSCPSSGSGNHTSAQCMLRKNFCDVKEHCDGGSDELTKGFGFKCLPASPQLRGSSCILPPIMIDDGVADCANDVDECTRNGRWRCFRCLDGSLVISDEQLCDGIIDCPDLSDECICSGKRPDICAAICGMKGSPDCSSPGTLVCASNGSSTEHKFVPFAKVCDDVNDCLATSYSPSVKYLDEGFCVHKEQSKKDMECRSGSLSSDNGKLRHGYAARCDGRPECVGFLDECDPHKPCDVVPTFCQNVSVKVDPRLRGELRFPCPEGIRADSPNQYGIPGPLVCNGIVDCKGAGEDELYCEQRYHCDAGKSAGRNIISIDVTQKCDGIIDCADKSDEKNCSEYFYCESGSPFFVAKAVRFDGTADCSDLSDECPTKQLKGAFASNTEMIANPLLRGMVWIMAVISTVGNLIVIGHQLKIFFHSKKLGIQKVALSNRVMLLNLALADLLTGIYLFLLAAKTLQFSGDYCKQDKTWRTSSTCANLGLLNSLATETAVVLLILMTSYRLLAVYKPFYTTSVSPVKIGLICACSWVVVFAVMMFPRMQRFSDYFTYTAWYPLPFFNSDVVKKDEILALIKRYNVLTENFNATEDTSWAFIENFVRQEHFNETNFAEFSYYSKHSVCIPNMLAANDDAAVAYSAFVTGFNLLAFAYVVIAYLFIYRGAVEKTRARQYSSSNSYVMRTQSTKPPSSEKELLKPNAVKTTTPKSTVMQRRIYRLVFSNLLCWAPITIMAILKLLGAELSSETYAIAAIILLPITSALNPILYSNFISTTWDRLKQAVCRKRSSDPTTQDPVPLTDRSQISTSFKSGKV